MTAEDTVRQLQLIEQAVQQLLVQKQGLQSQLIELESAIEELRDGEDAYRMVGNIMVKTHAKDLKTDLDSQKSRVSERIAALDKQEGRLREKAKRLQDKAMEDMKHGAGSDHSHP